MVKQNDPVETELSLDDKVDNNVGNDIAVPISNDGNTTEDNVNAGNEKEGARIRSESINSNYDISLPEDLKNEDSKMLPSGEDYPGDLSVNLVDLLSTKKKIMVPDANNTPTLIEVPWLFSMAYETQPIVNEFLFELYHVSECGLVNGMCQFSWCPQLKRIVSHASICTDTQCKECVILRSLLLLHSIQCVNPNCSLPFCSRYRTAWNIFIVNMNGCPAPDIKSLFSLIPAVSDGSPCFDNNRDLSPMNPVSPIPNPIQSTPHSPLVLSGGSLAQPIPPMNVPREFHPLSPTVVVSPQTSTLPNGRRRDTPMATHYIECVKCHKKRAVPSTLDENMIPNFECSKNIWDTQYNNCQYPENIQNNYTISLSGRTPQYSREQADFMYRLKLFIKSRNMGTFKQPMLGKREVDLYRLFREVTAYGGCDNVVKKEGTWSKIYRGMDNYSPTETSASYRLKKIYNKYLIEYEREMFNFQMPSPHGLDYFPRGDTKSPVVSYSSTPRSSTPTPSQNSYSFTYPQWQPKAQQVKRYQPPPTSPIPPQSYSPVPPMMTYQVPPMNYMPVQTQKQYTPPMYGQMPLNQQNYDYYDNSKRYCAVDSNMQNDIPQTAVPSTVPSALPMQVPDQQILNNDDFHQLMPLQQNVSAIPQGADSTGKWESLMNAATETAKQQKNGLNTSEMHI